MNPGRLRPALDVAGAIAAATLIASGYVAAASSGGDPDTRSAIVAGAVVIVLAASLVATTSRAAIPLLVVAATAMVAIASADDVLSRAPLSGPFRYANAKGAFFGQAAIAGMMLAAVGRRPWLRSLGAVAAVASAAVPILSATFAAAAFLPLAAVGVAVRGERTARTVVVVCAGLVALALATSVALAVTYRPSGRVGTLDRFVDETLTERRVMLWHEGWVLLREHPVTGVGPGRFRVESPIARSDPDARWAHQEFLEAGAETGVLGLVALAGVFAWGFARLAASPTPGRATALGAVALASLGVQSCVDYVLHFPVVPLMTAALVGVGVARRGRR